MNMLLNPRSANVYKTSRMTSLTQIYIKAKVQNQQTKPHFYGFFLKKTEIKTEERNQDLGQHSSTVQAIGLNIINDSNDPNAS